MWTPRFKELLSALYHCSPVPALLPSYRQREGKGLGTCSMSPRVRAASLQGLCTEVAHSLLLPSAEGPGQAFIFLPSSPGTQGQIPCQSPRHNHLFSAAKPLGRFKVASPQSTAWDVPPAATTVQTVSVSCSNPRSGKGS